MPTSFNLQEYILFRTEIKRELTNAEVDTNFQMVSNPWETTRLYQVGNIIYHPVVVDDPATTGEDQLLGWWRANKTTTQGVFDITQWDMVGGIGTSTINVLGSNGFGRINVNSTTAPGALQNGNDAVVTSTSPNDLFNIIAGAGMQLQYNLASKSIKIINTLASNPGEINIGENVGLGTGHQDVYAGQDGVKLQFNGFQSTNTSNVAGDALTVSTNVAQNNIEYNFDEGNVNLAALNSGATTIDMISDISAAVPNTNDVLQWNAGTGLWTPVALGALGQVNIYGDNGSIGAVDRLITLNGTSGNLQFNRAGDTGTGVQISNVSTVHQLELKQTNATLSSVIRFSNAGVLGASIGYTPIGTISSFGINLGGDLGGIVNDAFSIDDNNAIYVPQLENDNTLTTAAVTHRIPLVSGAAGSQGKFGSSDNLKATTYTNVDGETGRIKLELNGLRTQVASDPANSVFFQASETTANAKYGGASTTLIASCIANEYRCNNVTQVFTYDVFQYSTASTKRLIGRVAAFASADTPEIEQIVGSSISIANRPSVIGAGLSIALGQNIEFSEGAAGLANPQRVGLYSNVVGNAAGGTPVSTTLTELLADGGNWAGYFVGCVNIKSGGLVLPASTLGNRPLCNDTGNSAISNRTLWINSANGHLYRGTTDIEGAAAGAFLPLAGGTMTGSIAGDTTTTSISAMQQISAAQIISQLTALTPNGTTITWNTTAGTTVPLDLSAITLAISAFTITNLAGGATATLFFTGGLNSSIATTAWTGNGGTIKWESGVAPTTSTTGGTDIFTFRSDGTSVYGTVVLNLS